MHKEEKPTISWSLSRWLSWMESSHHHEIDLGLDRVRTVFSRLNIDWGDAHKIVIAGTNGKGTTTAYLDRIYRSAGYKTGSYTSPHLMRYNERVQLQGEEVADGLLCEAFFRIYQLLEGTSLSYFEFGTLAAFIILAESDLDVVLLEVGLGGRLDAVNLVDADISIITTLSYDHQDWLGDDLEKIGFEKAGVFRSRVPAVCGISQPPASVIEHAGKLGAPLFLRDDSFGMELTAENEWCWYGQDSQRNSLRIDHLPVPLLPLDNAVTALQVVALGGLEVKPEHLRQALALASVSGRMERCEFAKGSCYLDVAHNPESSGLLQKRIAAKQRPVYLVLAMLADKDIAGVIASLKPSITRWYVAGLAVPRGASKDRISAEIEKAGISQSEFLSFDSVDEAFLCALNDLPTGVDLYVAGSFYTVAAVKKLLQSGGVNGAAI